MIRFPLGVFFILTLWLAAIPAQAQSLYQGGAGRVVQVVDGDTVVLDVPIDGASQVRLVGIQAPKLPLGRRNFKKWPLADESKRALERLVLGQRVSLKFGGRRMDRHGRLLAHLYTEDGAWVQGGLLQSGMARVYSFPDNRALIADMLALEGTAREHRRGLWGNGFYGVRAADKIDRLIGTFQLIEGRIHDAQTVRGKTYLNFTDDWRSDFTISITRKALKSFAAGGIDPLALKGRMVRVRGWIKKRNGPMIEASHPEQIEIIEE